MKRRPFADVVALWQPDRRERWKAGARLESIDGIELVHERTGWLVGIRALPHTDRRRVYSPDHYIAIPQGGDLLLGSDPDEPRPWVSIAEDLTTRTGFCAKQADSDFAVARFGRNGHLQLMQTHAVLMPSLVSTEGEWLAYSTCLDMIALARPVPPEADRAIAAIWCNGRPFFVEGRSVLKGVGEYPRGARVEVRPGHAPRVTLCDTEFLGRELGNARLGKQECGEWLREIVLGNLRRDLVTDGVNLLALSCGRDSSTIASVVHQTMKLPMSTASVLPTDRAVRARELSFAEPSLEGLPDENRIIIDWPDMRYQAQVLSKAPNVLHPILHPMLCEMGDILDRTPIDVYFGGEFCDEMIGGEAVLPEWVRDLGLFRALWRAPISTQRAPLVCRHIVRRRFRWLDAFALKLRHRADPQEIGQPFDPALRSDPVSQGPLRPAGSTSTAGEMLHRFRSNYAPILGMNWAASAALGVRRAFPLLTREVMSLLWTTRPRHRLHPATKELFNCAFGDISATRAVTRPDKGIWDRVLPDIGVPATPGLNPLGIFDLGKLDTAKPVDAIRFGLALQIEDHLGSYRSSYDGAKGDDDA